MKKNKMMRIASVLLVAVLLSTCAISGTFAKYTATISNNDTARVAKFEVVAFGETASSTTDTASMDLWKVSEVYDSADITGDDYAAATKTADADIATTEYLMAPGSWGVFSFDIENNSEVNVTYSIDYTVNEAGVPLEWSVDGKTWTEDLADTSGTLAMNSAAVPTAVYWRWAYNGSDTDDTTLGITGSAAPTIGIAVTFTQVN